MAGDQWEIGDRVECDKYPTKLDGRNRSTLTIWGFDNADGPKPVAVLLYKEWDGRDLAHERFYHVYVSELRVAGSSPKTRIAPGMRAVLGLEPIPCGCHCGENTSGAQFKQGHDARLKGALQRWANDRKPKLTETDNWVRANLSSAEAAAELKWRGWPPGKPAD